jgi:hypothetical protein
MPRLAEVVSGIVLSEPGMRLSLLTRLSGCIDEVRISHPLEAVSIDRDLSQKKK